MPIPKRLAIVSNIVFIPRQAVPSTLVDRLKMTRQHMVVVSLDTNTTFANHILARKIVHMGYLGVLIFAMESQKRSHPNQKPELFLTFLMPCLFSNQLASSKRMELIGIGFSQRFQILVVFVQRHRIGPVCSMVPDIQTIEIFENQ